MAPLDVIISKNPMRTRQPDILFVSHGRLRLIDERLHSAPDLVVEILSPGNTRKQIEQKLRDYAAIGVREAWIADRRQKSISVLHPERDEFRQTAVCRGAQQLRSRVLPRLRLAARRIFP